MSTPQPYLDIIGDIGVTQTLIVTPNGTCALADSTWIVRDNSTTTEKIPPWAIVMAVLFFVACLLGLLFLLAKERTTTGYVEVSIRGTGLYHVCQLPVSNPTQIAHIRSQVTNIQIRAAQSV